MELLNEQSSKPIDASDIETVTQAAEELKQLRFALKCGAPLHLFQLGTDQEIFDESGVSAEVRSAKISLPRTAVVSIEQPASFNSISKLLETLGEEFGRLPISLSGVYLEQRNLPFVVCTF